MAKNSAQNFIPQLFARKRYRLKLSTQIHALILNRSLRVLKVTEDFQNPYCRIAQSNNLTTHYQEGTGALSSVSLTFLFIQSQLLDRVSCLTIRHLCACLRDQTRPHNGSSTLWGGFCLEFGCGCSGELRHVTLWALLEKSSITQLLVFVPASVFNGLRWVYIEMMVHSSAFAVTNLFCACVFYF